MKSLQEAYDLFEKEYKKIHEYFVFSGLSFALVGTMQDQAKEKAKQTKIRVKKKESSFSKADHKIEEISVICEWVSLQEYSEREKLPLNSIEEQARAGVLGPTHEEGSELYVIWPKERQQDTDLPEFGKKMFEIKYSQSIETKAIIENSEQALSALGHYPDLAGTIDRSQQQLCPTCLLLYWTAFEGFVKDFIDTLYYLHPEQVLKKYGKNPMTLNAVFDGSHRFTDMDSLKRRVLEEVLAKYDRENISKLIEFVEDCYLSKGTDPFSTKFIYSGDKTEVNRGHLDQIRIIRNALIHYNGRLSEKEWKLIDLVPREGDNPVVQISEDSLGKMYYILKSIAYNLFDLTSKQYPEGKGKK